MASTWVEEWTVPPINEEQLECWRIYTVVWNECQLTPPGWYVRRWLLSYGLPSSNGYTDRYFKRALDVYMNPGRDRRRP